MTNIYNYYISKLNNINDIYLNINNIALNICDNEYIEGS